MSTATTTLDAENPKLVPTTPFGRDNKEYLTEAASALYLERNPKARDLPATMVAPNGKIVAITEGGPTEWYSEIQIKEHHLRIAMKALDELMHQLADKVPANIRTHEWYKKSMAAMIDIQAFPSLPK